MHVFSVYAPLQDDHQCSAFTAELFYPVSTLDMQTPLLLMGDFNGTVTPDRDSSSGVGPAHEKGPAAEERRAHANGAWQRDVARRNPSE